MKNLLAVASVALLSCLAAAPAHADTVTDLGSVYTLSYSAAGGGVYDVTLKINATGFTGGSSDFLGAVALKIVPQTSDITNIMVLAEPSGYASTTMSGGLSASGCDGSGNGFFCLPYTGAGLGKPVGSAGDIYTFTFAVTVPTASNLLTATDAASIKAGYLTPSGGNAGITSIPATLSPSAVPEPSSIALFSTALLGTLLLGAAGTLRRRMM